MATAELLCCDIRAGVKSGTGTSQPEGQPPQDTCCGPTGPQDLAPAGAKRDGAPHRGGAPLSCHVSRSELAAPPPAGRASVPTARGRGAHGRRRTGLAGPPCRPPSHTREGPRLTSCLGRGAPSIRLTINKRNWGAACGPQKAEQTHLQASFPSQRQDPGCGWASRAWRLRGADPGAEPSSGGGRGRGKVMWPLNPPPPMEQKACPQEGLNLSPPPPSVWVPLLGLRDAESVPAPCRENARSLCPRHGLVWPPSSKGYVLGEDNMAGTTYSSWGLDGLPPLQAAAGARPCRPLPPPALS